MKFEKNGCVDCANLREELEIMKYDLGIAHNKIKYANDMFKHIVNEGGKLDSFKMAEHLMKRFDPLLEFLEEHEFLKPTQESTDEL